MVILILHLVQNQPAIIPASGAGGIPDDQPFGFIQAFRAERVVFRKLTKLAQQVVGIDVMSPGAGHRLRDFGRVQVREDFLDATQFGERVDAPGSEGMDEPIFVTLKLQPSTLPPFGTCASGSHVTGGTERYLLCKKSAMRDDEEKEEYNINSVTANGNRDSRKATIDSGIQSTYESETDLTQVSRITQHAWSDKAVLLWSRTAVGRIVLGGAWIARHLLDNTSGACFESNCAYRSTKNTQVIPRGGKQPFQEQWSRSSSG